MVMNMSAMRRAMLVVALALLAIGCGSESAQTDPVVKRVKVLEVGRVSTVEERRISGRVVAAESSRLSFGVAGTIAEITVNAGDRFPARQVLARLDEAPLQIALDQAQAAVVVARARAREAEQTWRRITGLFEQDAASQAELEAATSPYESARGSLRAEEASLERKQRDLRLATIRAPFAGQVTERVAEPFQEIGGSQEVLAVQAEGAFEVEVAVPEAMIRHVEYGQAVTVSFPSLDLAATGAVSEIGARSVDGGGFPVSVRIGAEYAELRAGISASVQFAFSREDGGAGPVYLIPLSAIAVDAAIASGQQDGSGDAMVYVVGPDERLVLRAVRIGTARGDDLEVFSGLEAGERVVVAGVPFLSEGMRVSIWRGGLGDG
jgi:RND family efflux transporter MFP subunit